MPFTRTIRRGDSGPDCEAVGRALCHVKLLLPIAVFNALPKAVRQRFGFRKVAALKKFQKRQQLPVDGVYGRKTHDRLARHFDAKALDLLKQWKSVTKEDIAFEKLVNAMREMSDHTPGYSLGGGHGVRLWDVSSRQKLDCSSSTSKALYEAGLFPDTVAWVSGNLAHWGSPGPGNYFTVYANSEHVFVRLHKSRWWRFDTSPHGDGGRGPKLRYLPRFTSHFSARHYRGM